MTDEGAWVANVGPGLTRYDREGNVTAEVATDGIKQAMQVGFGRLWRRRRPTGATTRRCPACLSPIRKTWCGFRSLA